MAVIETMAMLALLVGDATGSVTFAQNRFS
jgi:hypothetical protein